MKWCCGPGGGIPVDGLWINARIWAGAAQLTHFTLSSANDTPGRDPLHWAIQGSNDGVNYTDIYVKNDPTSIWNQQNPADVRNQVIRFDAGPDFPVQATAYRTFRFVTFNTALNPSGAYFQVAEVEYFGNIPDPVSPGDFNEDGSVDLDDYDSLANNFRNTYTDLLEAFSDGDANHDGTVNLVDFGIFVQEFNGQGGAVPEPSTVVLGVVGAVFACLCGRLRRRK
jgi:hypothetical protein